MRGRIVRLLAATLLGVTACSSPADTTDRPSATPPEEIEHVELPQVAAGPREDGPSALDNMRDQRLPKPLLDPDKVVSGGPPPDGIPPIDEPRFSRARTIGWLTDTEPLLSLTVGAETRGYPLQIMTWHEIVNDTVGGTPVAVTYCPLCNSGVAFERRGAERVLSFGTSGRLYADNLVMYDRQTESLWPQLTGRAALGVLTGTTLRAIPMGTVAWGDFRAAHPDAWVLTRDTGHDRPYGRNPYAGYDEPSGEVLFELPSKDARLPVKERVVGVAAGRDAMAVVRSQIARRGVLEVSVGGKDLIVWHRPGQASALDDERIVRGRDVGTVAVYEPVVKDRRLNFVAAGNGFRDRETGVAVECSRAGNHRPAEGTAARTTPTPGHVLVRVGCIPSRDPVDRVTVETCRHTDGRSWPRCSWARPRDAVLLVVRGHIVKKALPVAAVVGTVLSLVNQGSVVAGGAATRGTWVRVAVNYLVPFLVASIGYLSGRRVRAPAVDWPHYLAGYHRDRPGITERLLTRAVAVSNAAPYPWLVEPLRDTPGPVLDLACGSAPTRALLGQGGMARDRRIRR